MYINYLYTLDYFQYIEKKIANVSIILKSTIKYSPLLSSHIGWKAGNKNKILIGKETYIGNQGWCVFLEPLICSLNNVEG